MTAAQRICLLALAALGLLAAPPAAKAAPADPAASTSARADAQLAAFRPDRPGLAVLVARHGEVVYERYLGMADVEYAAPVTPATRFNIASASKQFTALAALQLAHAGRIDLQADIRQYLPELPDYGAKITVSDLIHHTSGIRDASELEFVAGTPLDGVIRQKALVAMAANQRELNFAPGTEFRYSNTGYTLLAEIVARASGQPFRQYLQAKVFQPLKMNDTLVYDDTSMVLPNRAMSYFNGPAGSVRFAPLNASTYGQTNVTATARDLLKWSRELLHPTVLAADLVGALETPGKLKNGTPLLYAGGVTLEPVMGHRAISHTGADAGYRALIASFPDEDATIIVLSNGGADVGKLGDDLAAIFLPPAPTPKPVAPDPAKVAALAGFYVNDWGPGLDLVAADGKLYVARGGPRREATFLPDGSFYVFGPSSRLTPRPDGTLAERQPIAGVPIIHRRAARATPTPVDLAGLPGRYRSDELDVTYTVKVAGPTITLTSLRNEPFPFFPADHDHFENPLVKLTVLRDAAGQVTGLSIATGRVRDLRFTKLAGS